MCVVSMVSDHWKKQFEPYVAQPSLGTFTGGLLHQFTQDEAATLRKMIADYQKSMDAARTVDALTGQPDCADPEKVKLQERVAELEQQLAAVREALK